MKTRYLVIGIIVLLFPIAIFFMRWSADRAKKTSDQILEEFKKVGSAESCYEPSIEQMIEGLQETVNKSAAGHPKLKATADSLMALRAGLQSYIQKLKADNPVSEEKPVPMTLKKEEVAGLQHRMNEFYKFCKAHLATEKAKARLEDNYANLLFTNDANAFGDAYFTNMPGVAVHTLLSKFSNDANAGAELVLTEMVDRVNAPAAI